MSLNHQRLRQLFADFWESKKHELVSPASLILKDDPTTLFISSGMQPLVKYLAGAPHPLGQRLYNIQPCFRAVDIDEVGDNRHTTFFEMMGNWSLGDYFKEDQLAWCWEFFTEIVGLSKDRLYISVFDGDEKIRFWSKGDKYAPLTPDVESISIWKKLGVPHNHIFYYGVEKNWWSRAGTPDQMPAGEIGGPDSEIFYEFDTPHDKKFGQHCHPNCDCGRFLEIGNSVFIQYRKRADGALEELPQKNVDFGGGLERVLAASRNNPDVFQTDVFADIIGEIEKVTGKQYSNKSHQAFMRVIADHLKAATFLIAAGVTPSNKQQGYVLRRLLRRAAVKMYQLEGRLGFRFGSIIDRGLLRVYDDIIDRSENKETINEVVDREMRRFGQSLDKGLALMKKLDAVDGKTAFDLYQNHGFPFEIIQELATQKGIKVSREEFEQELKRHRELSQKASPGMSQGALEKKFDGSNH